jgi:hypothetical protein
MTDQHGRSPHWRQCWRRTFGTATVSDQCLGAQRGKGLASADSEQPHTRFSMSIETFAHKDVEEIFLPGGRAASGRNFGNA